MAILISIALLCVGIGVLVIIHTCIVGRAFRRGFTNSNSNNIVETSSFGSRSMSRDEIEKLPRFDFRAREKGSSPMDCAVCLDNFKAGDKCRLLPLCSHSFHAECIDLWLLKTPICPVCRSSADLQTTGPSIPGEESGRHYNSDRVTGSIHIQAASDAATPVELRENHLSVDDDSELR